jgi:prepilin-type N-terminal cleavage/methylation domain-containing protein
MVELTPDTGSEPGEEKTKGKRGFTLLEVMISLTLMAVGVLSLAALQLLVMQYGSRGRHMTEASAIAQTQMEQLQRLRWTDASMLPTGGGWAGPTTINVQVQDTGGVVYTQESFDVYVRIADMVAGVTRSVDVRVDWDEQNRPGRSYALSSIRYNQEGL